jgi:hypothetical protein
MKWSSETDDPNVPISAAFTRYGLMLSVLEPIETEAQFEAKIQVMTSVVQLCQARFTFYSQGQQRVVHL